jgi:putative transposase
MKTLYRSKQYRRKFKKELYKKITHTSYALYYHIVWSVKKRIHLIDNSMEVKMASLLQKKCKELGVNLLSLGINPEHIHMIIGLKPTHHIPEVVKKLKGFSAHEINKDGGNFIKWTRGYSIRTVGESNLKSAIKYVRDQKKKHQWEG